MKVRCPKCGTVSNVDSEKIPDEGMHARCPKCNNRMFLRKPGQPQPSAESRPPEKPAPKPAGATPERASEALRRSRAGVEEEPEFIPAIVKHDIGTPLGCIIPLVAVILVSVIIIIIGLVSEPETVVEPIKLEPIAVAGKEPPRYFRQDLMELRRTLVQYRGESYTAMGARPECRLVYQLLNSCGKACGRIDQAVISPLGSDDGFTAAVQCSDGPHQLAFFWTDNRLVVDGAECK